MAAYAFEVYNEPIVGKPALGLDNTEVFFTSLPHIRRAFSGAIVLTIKTLKLQRSEEEQLLERLVSGNKPDPFVIATIYENYSPNPKLNRILDSIRSSTQKNTDFATWETDLGYGQYSEGETHALYLRDGDSAALEFAIFDEEVFSEDEFLGNTVLSFSELKDIVRADHNLFDIKDYELMLPIYAENKPTEKSGFLDSLMNTVRKPAPMPRRQRVGTLNVSVTYLPWTMLSDSQVNNLVVLGETSFATTARIYSEQNLTDIKSTDWRALLSNGLKNFPNFSIPISTPLFNLTLSNSATPDTINYNKTDSDRSNFLQPSLPRGATPLQADWTSLLQTILSTDSYKPEGKLSFATDLIAGLQTNSMHQICLIDNPHTDTQVGIWADIDRQTMLLSFRGTESINDALTDMNFLQAPFRSDHEMLAQSMVHQGFLAAYQHIQLAILQQMNDLFLLGKQFHHDPQNVSTGSSSGRWEIFITGHSLGGALATLLAYDLGRIREGWYNTSSLLALTASTVSTRARPSSSTSSKGDAASKIGNPSQRSPRHVHFAESLVDANEDATLLFLDDAVRGSTNQSLRDAGQSQTVLLQSLRQAELIVYTFGAPRVGNSQFKKAFNQLITHCYRVVNQQDIVARLPRGSRAGFSDFEHVGRTVLIDEKYQPSANTSLLSAAQTSSRHRSACLWIEGETVDACPLQDVAIFSSSNLNDSVFMEKSLARPEREGPTETMISVNDLRDKFTNYFVGAVLQNIGPETMADKLHNLTSSVKSKGTDTSNPSTGNSWMDSLKVPEVSQEMWMKGRAILQSRVSDWQQGQSWSRVVEDLQQLGVDKTFFEREVALLSSLWDLSGVNHHLEPAYFEAMVKISGVSLPANNASLEI